MATKSLSFLAIFAMVAAANFFDGATAFGGRKSLASAEAPAPAPTAVEEAFVVLDAGDANVVEIAKFAVEEHNKQTKSNLVFESVFTAAFTHTSGGINYGLVIVANDGSGSEDAYNANVLVNNGDRELVALWKKVGDDGNS